MDPAIWSPLPKELLEHVLSFLPLKTLLSLRSTSKYFKDLVLTPSFVSKHSFSSSPFPMFLLLSHPQFQTKFPLYDTTHNTWRNLPVPGFPPMLSPPPSKLQCVSNGRLCFSNLNSSCFLVCSIFEKSSRIVRSPIWPSNFKSLTLVPTSNGGYKLFLILSSSSGSSSTSTAFVYNSSVHRWQQFEALNQIIYHQNGVLHKGLLYFITPEPFHIVCFDLENGKWVRSTAALPDGLVFARLASDGDRKLRLIGGIGSDGISKSMKLWELSEGGENWGDVGRLPEMMFRKIVSVCYHKYDHIYCFWHEDLVHLCCNTWPELLYYKVSRKTWHWLLDALCCPRNGAVVSGGFLLCHSCILLHDFFST